MFKNKCLLCSHYTDENAIDECKIWAFDDRTGIAPDLNGCPQLSYKEEVIEYNVRIFGSETKTYRFYNKAQLEAFLIMQDEKGIGRCFINIEEVVRIANQQ